MDQFSHFTCLTKINFVHMCIWFIVGDVLDWNVLESEAFVRIEWQPKKDYEFAKIFYDSQPRVCKSINLEI